LSASAEEAWLIGVLLLAEQKAQNIDLVFDIHFLQDATNNKYLVNSNGSTFH